MTNPTDYAANIPSPTDYAANIASGIQAMAADLEAERAYTQKLKAELRQAQSHLASERFSNGLVRDELDASRDMLSRQTGALNQLLDERDEYIAELESRLVWVRSNVPAKFMQMDEDSVDDESWKRHDDATWERMKEGLSDLTLEYQNMWRETRDSNK